jgi:hypothetical protein
VCSVAAPAEAALVAVDSDDLKQFVSRWSSCEPYWLADYEEHALHLLLLLLSLLLLLQSVVRSDEEWQRVLSPGQYKILRQAGTELPRTRCAAARSTVCDWVLPVQFQLTHIQLSRCCTAPHLLRRDASVLGGVGSIWHLPADSTAQMHKALHLTCVVGSAAPVPSVFFLQPAQQ